MKNLAALAIALALTLPVSAGATPNLSHTRLPDAAFEYRLTFPASDTDDSAAMSVRGMCSVTFVVAGSDAVSLYLIPSDSTAAASGTLIGAFTASTTAATTFQSGAMWVKAVATTATTGGSIMRIHCSNEQVASTGEACTTAGLAPYVGDLGGYKCEPEYNYDDVDNELSVGSIVLDPVAGKNSIRFPTISEFTGVDPTATEALLYCLSGDQECYVENLDGLNAPSRVVTASPDFYDVVLSWGVAFEDVDNEYITLAPGPGTPVVRTFCMVKAPFVDSERTYSSNGEVDDVVIPLTGTNGCSIAATQTRPKQAYPLMGDPFVKDAWCTTHTNTGGGGGIWATGDEVVVRFGVSNAAEVIPSEYLASIHDMTYGFDEIFAYKGAVDRHTELRETVGAFASSALTGTVDPAGIEMALFTAHIIGMTRASGSTWNAIQLQCSLGIMFKDTR